MGQVWYLIVSIPDFCTLTYYKRIAKSLIADYKQMIRKKTLADLKVDECLEQNGNACAFKEYKVKHMIILKHSSHSLIGVLLCCFSLFKARSPAHWVLICGSCISWPFMLFLFLNANTYIHTLTKFIA